MHASREARSAVSRRGRLAGVAKLAGGVQPKNAAPVQFLLCLHVLQLVLFWAAASARPVFCVGEKGVDVRDECTYQRSVAKEGSTQKNRGF